jgi:hydrogenase nickel incorporation protein HypA/HybF
MHELAITESMIDVVAERVGSARVVRVQLEIGKLSGVVADAMRFCFELSAEGTPLAGARLEILEPPGRARCLDCDCEIDLDTPIALCTCGSANLDLLSGRELKILEVEVA